MSASTRWVGFASSCAVLTLSGMAQAQDSAVAQALFERGVAALEAGELESACPALAESHRLDPRAGTLFALAECEAKAGKLASAFGHYQDYLGLVSRLSAEQQERHAERAAIAREQTRLLRPQVPTLTLVLPAAAPPGLLVERDGITLRGPALGVALPIDPGEHVVVTRDPAGNETRTTVTIAPGEAVRLELRAPVASPAPPAPVSVPVPVPTPPPPPQATEPSLVVRESSSSRRTWAWIAGGLGMSGVVVGSIAGGVALAKKGVVTDHCRGEECDSEGKRAADVGQSAATVSTVAFGVGLVGLGTSLVLMLTSESSPSGSARLGPSVGVGADGAFASFEGAF
jgi:hypothetical protein